MSISKKTMIDSQFRFAQQLGLSEDASNVLMEFKGDFEKKLNNIVDLIKNNRIIMNDLDLMNHESHTCQSFIIEEGIEMLVAIYLGIFIKEKEYKNAMDIILEEAIKTINSYKQQYEREND